uniref:Reverse transcriptase domain-containing protein n=1 Tax=Megaselia scalaris TaxID=36166 RepID=T1GFU1_MEGSC
MAKPINSQTKFFYWKNELKHCLLAEYIECSPTDLKSSSSNPTNLVRSYQISVRVSANINTGSLIFNKSHQILAYVYDIVRSSVNVVESFLRLERAVESVGLQINENKTKYMLST